MATAIENKDEKDGISALSGKPRRLDIMDEMSPTAVNRGNSGLASMTVDEAIDSIPIGLFHYRLLALCGSSFLADAAEVKTC